VHFDTWCISLLGLVLLIACVSFFHHCKLLKGLNGALARQELYM
jgi:hypothetical protein